MLFRLDNPRLIVNAQEFPQNVVLYSLAYEDSDGAVTISFQDTHPETVRIEAERRLQILPGMVLHEFVLPFMNLHDSLGRRASTHGFRVTARSAFRVAAATYGIRTLTFTMLFPVIGGGVIRMDAGGQEWELANPTFTPTAPIPGINHNYGAGAGNEYASGPAGIDNLRVPDEILINAYQRTHQGHVGPVANEVERRRQERLANFNLREVPAPAPDLPAFVTMDQANTILRETRQPAPPPAIVVPPERPKKDRFDRVSEEDE